MLIQNVNIENRIDWRRKNIYRNIYNSKITYECQLCGKLSFGTCNECWTVCQTCGRGMNTQDCSSISVEGFEHADFCIQCSSNLFSFGNEVTPEKIIQFAQDVQPFVKFLGMTNVIFLSGTQVCGRCQHRIPNDRSYCDECRYIVYIETMNKILPRSHSENILKYIGVENLS